MLQCVSESVLCPTSSFTEVNDPRWRNKRQKVCHLEESIHSETVKVSTFSSEKIWGQIAVQRKAIGGIAVLFFLACFLLFLLNTRCEVLNVSYRNVMICHVSKTHSPSAKRLIIKWKAPSQVQVREYSAQCKGLDDNYPTGRFTSCIGSLEYTIQKQHWEASNET